MDDRLFEIITQCLPDELEIDEQSDKLTAETLQQIKENYDKYLLEHGK